MLLRQRKILYRLLIFLPMVSCFIATAQTKTISLPQKDTAPSQTVRVKAIPSREDGIAEKKLQVKTLLKKINGVDLVHKENAADSLSAWNGTLLYSLQNCISVFPDFMQRDFPDWKDAGLTILTSADKKFRIICWNTRQSGTSQQWTSVVFWQGKNELYSSELGDEEYIRSRPAVTGITDVRLNDGTSCYLVQARGHADNRYKYDYIKAYQVTPAGMLATEVKLFIAGTKETGSIGCSIDMASVAALGASGDQYPLIHFSPDKSQLYIPVVTKDGAVKKGAYLTYSFNGSAFIYQ
ncbi:MAG TPA: hypothetical protein VF421_19145 [Niabella sp.]